MQSLRDFKTFRQFYALFRPEALVQPVAGVAPDAVTLLQRTQNRQREVGDKLYQDYSEHRARLIAHLVHPHRWLPDEMFTIMNDIAERSVLYYFSKYREEHFQLP